MAVAQTVKGAVLLFIGATGTNIPDFNEFAKLFGKEYLASSAEHETRRETYEKNAAHARKQNSDPNRLWTAGANEFWDWGPLELSKLLGWNPGARPDQSFGGATLKSVQKVGFLQGNRTLPESKSWAHLQTAKKQWNQGSCGSCWAVAAVTVLQSATEISGNMRTFSAQEMVECTPNPRQCGGQGGCTGATVELAMDWVMKTAVSDELKVPYKGYTTGCQNKNVLAAPQGGNLFGMVGWEMLPRNKHQPLMRAIAEDGPVAVSADASWWQMYSKGIFNGCQPDAIVNHAITAIGYGVDQGTKFWHIKNSWGDSWGEKGTIRLLRRDTDDTECGIDNKPEQGSGCKGGPSQVKVCGMCGVLFDSVAVHMRR